MSVWTRPRGRREARSSVFPTLTLSDYAGMLASRDAMARMEDALRGIAVRSSVDLIASLISEAPFGVFSGEGKARVARPKPSYLDDPAGDGTGAQDWVYQLLQSWLLRGNVYGANVAMRGTGPGAYPTQVDLWHPDCVTYQQGRDGAVAWFKDGREVPDGEFFHRRVNPVPERPDGLSVIGLHARQMRISLAATRYGLGWFESDGRPGSVLTADSDISKMDDARISAIKQRFLSGLHDSAAPRGQGISLLGRGWKYETIQVAPEDSQFLETVGKSEAQCCRMFGPGVAEILGYDSGGTLTYANVESRMTHLTILTLNKWVQRAQRVLTSMLPRPQYVLIDVDAMARSTTLARYQAHESALKNRWKVVNEVRAAEGLLPVAWGEEPNDSFYQGVSLDAPPDNGSGAPPAGGGNSGQ